MENKSPIMRWVLALWLISSQIAGAAIVLAPVVVLFTFSTVQSAQESAGFNVLMILGYILPVVFIGLGIAAWVMFARRKDSMAGWLALATLAPGALMLLAVRLIV